jgi:hypothetical protein
MKRIAGAGVGILAVMGILVYVVWPAVSSAGRGDDAPIRVRNGSVYIDSGWDVEGTPQNPKRWKFKKKDSCRDSDDGSLSPCFSREPESGTNAPGDTDRNDSLTVAIKFGKGGVCAAETTSTSQLPSPVIGDGNRATFWLNGFAEDPRRSFSFRRNTSGFFHFRAQLAPTNRFDSPDDGFTLNFRPAASGDYIERLVVRGIVLNGQRGKLNCAFEHDPSLTVLICSKWNKTYCSFK